MRYKMNIVVSRYMGLLSILALSCFISCSHSIPKYSPEDPLWLDNDRKNIDEPESRDPGLVWTAIYGTTFEQAEEALDLNRGMSKLTGNPEQSANINSFDEVPNSTWFTNRHHLKKMSPHEIAAGPIHTPGPDTGSVWKVYRPKVGGATVGFWIEDSRGDKYIIKFDPAGYPEMATAAAAMGSRFFHACGYTVPQETIVYWRPENLLIREGATIKNKKGEKRPFTMDDLNEILDQVHHEPDGRIRSIASLLIEGKIKGPFNYSGRRKDDPNDWFPHEDRRELRGLYVPASLINHYDVKQQNSLDTYVTENGKSYLKHYLMDFGSTFGSDGNDPKPPLKGYANMFDLNDIFGAILSLGINVHGYEHAEPIKYQSIGYFESEIFKPDKFDPILPNPAFEKMTDRDAYWGTKIVMAFSDDDLWALVGAGKLSDKEAEKYLIKTLIERRDKIGRHWFSKINPLDYFEVEQFGRELHISFEDLAVKYNLASNNAKYKYVVLSNGRELFYDRTVEKTIIVLSEEDLISITTYYNQSKKNNNLFEVRIKTSRESGHWSKPTALWLWYHPDENRLQLVGIEHLD